jgi:hypothetical protein
MHIENLYRPNAMKVLAFKRVYAMEKIHGTSSHITWNGNDNIKFFSGGCKHDSFVKLFNKEELIGQFKGIVGSSQVTIFGEAYGGKVQGMSRVYGDKLGFIAFEVYIDNMWLSVPQAYDLVNKMGLSFVDFVEVPAIIEELDKQRDRLSSLALLNLMGDHPREGIVIRPPFEVVTSNHERIIAKHKTIAYGSERTQQPQVGDALVIATNANKIANDWVTPTRLEHVLDSLKASDPLGTYDDLNYTPKVIFAMQEDIRREGSNEIEFTKPVFRAIGNKTVALFKAYIDKKWHDAMDGIFELCKN